MNSLTKSDIYETPILIGQILREVYTNIIESLNRCIQKYTKTKSIFSHDEEALKADYLAIGNIEKNRP